MGIVVKKIQAPSDVRVNKVAISGPISVKAVISQEDMIVVKKIDTPTLKVAVKKTGDILQTSLDDGVTLATSSSSAVNRLDALNDVDEPASPTNNSTLVYDELTDRYVVKQLDLDGGGF